MANVSLAIQAGAQHQLPLGKDTYRKYVARLTSELSLTGHLDVAHKASVYKVGFRGAPEVTARPTDNEIQAEFDRRMAANPRSYVGSKARRELMKRLRSSALRGKLTDSGDTGVVVLHTSLQPPAADVPLLQQTYRVSDMVAADFSSAAKKYTSVSGDFAASDHSALVERLAMGLAYYTFTGQLSMEDLAARRPVVVTPVSMLTVPLCAATTSVWLPRSIDAITSPNVLAAIVSACAGIGSTPVTDLVELDQDNRALVPSAEDADLVEGVYGALRIIGSNYEHNGAGALFAYALTRGVHQVASVVAMTDEGGITRDVFRRHGFVPSFGGISAAHRGWQGLARPNTLSVASWAGLVDAIALTTAAGVAVADPCVNVNGKTYPTVISSSRMAPLPAGRAAIGDVVDAAGIGARLRGVAGPFAANYISYLETLFHFRPGHSSSVAASHLVTCYDSVATSGSRHLQYPSVAPFYWVEPTGVIGFDVSGYTACRAGYGPLCYPGASATMPMFESYSTVVDEGDVSEGACVWRSARTSGLALHLGNHSDDGLANVRIVGADPEAWIHVGGESKDVAHRMRDGDDLASYLWARGDVAVPAPSEAMYIGDAVALCNLHSRMDHNTWRSADTHYPAASELSAGVTLSTTRLIPYVAGPRGPDRHANRAYTKALAALDAARVTARFPTGRRAGQVRLRDVVLPTTASQLTPPSRIPADEGATPVTYAVPPHIQQPLPPSQTTVQEPTLPVQPVTVAMPRNGPVSRTQPALSAAALPPPPVLPAEAMAEVVGTI